MNRYAFLAAVLVILCGNSASATPILYDEFFDGDLPGMPELTQLVLGTGLNIVRGETSVFPSALPDPDSFIFVVPTGMRLVSGRVDATDSAGDIIELAWSFQDGPITSISRLERLVLSSPGSATFTTTPLGPGMYYMLGGYWAHPGDVVSSSLYVFRLEVAAVPEPPSSSSMWLGIVTALVVRKRWYRRASPAP